MDHQATMMLVTKTTDTHNTAVITYTISVSHL